MDIHSIGLNKLARNAYRALTLAVFANMLLACGGASEDSTNNSAGIAPTISISANPAAVGVGEPSTLAWSATNATRCVASGAWSGGRAVSGTESTGALSSTSTYVLECEGAGGHASDSVTVTATSQIPALSLNATPMTVNVNEPATLTWSTSNVKNCVASGAWSGDRAISGSESTGPLSATSTFSLDCNGPNGAIADSVVVSVNSPTAPAPKLSLSAAPTSVAFNESATLTWAATDADNCVASGDWSGNRSTSGSQGTGPLGDTSMYALNCTGAGGSVSKSVTITVDYPPPTLSLGVAPTTVNANESATISWSATNASDCSASGAWSGGRATVGSKSTGPLTTTSTYALYCDGPGGSVSDSVTVSVNATPPTLSLSANPSTVNANESAVLAWSTTDAASCSASGDWSGSRGISGSESTGSLSATSTYSLNCVGAGGSVNRTVTVTVASGTAAGLDFPGSAAVSTTMRFRFLNPLSIYPATYIWRAYPRQQAGYYTAFFWGNDDGRGDLSTFLWQGGGADSYYGAHPYPDPPPGGSAHNWEISIEQADYQNGRVVYNRWYTQALRVWVDQDGYKHHEFYWDLPYADAAHRVIRTSPPDWGNTDPPVPTLTWGDAPWAPGNEVWNGVLRGIRVYSTNLSMANILSEANLPLSTAEGRENIWYLNMDPTPSDISDKSGRGHDPEWVGNMRPSLWSE